MIHLLRSFRTKPIIPDSNLLEQKFLLEYVNKKLLATVTLCYVI